MNQQVTAPRFVVYAPGSLNTTATPGAITVYPSDAAGNWHYTNENVTVTLTSSSQAVGRIDSATVVIPAGSNYNNNARFIPVSSGTVQVTASDARGTAYAYASGSATVSVTTPTLYLSWGGAQRLGVGQWTDPYVYSPDYPATPLTVNLSHLTSTSSTPASVTIPTNLYYQVHRITAVAIGNDSITYSASGHNPIAGFVQVGQGRIDALGSWPGSARLRLGAGHALRARPGRDHPKRRDGDDLQCLREQRGVRAARGRGRRFQRHDPRGRQPGLVLAPPPRQRQRDGHVHQRELRHAGHAGRDRHRRALTAKPGWA